MRVVLPINIDTAVRTLQLRGTALRRAFLYRSFRFATPFGRLEFAVGVTDVHHHNSVS